jgi:hypothetical protein
MEIVSAFLQDNPLRDAASSAGCSRGEAMWKAAAVKAILGRSTEKLQSGRAAAKQSKPE